ncbi:hypothetical protein SHKM778_61820 [Streptomyces sp. KM77-8]|uniref:Uncharacterized protein n=1 Tax=Streptomyces haneummycinicus TaxID=3074435 RepID=A0AAT9HR04_9ACTN
MPSGRVRAQRFGAAMVPSGRVPARGGFSAATVPSNRGRSCLPQCLKDLGGNPQGGMGGRRGTCREAPRRR